MQTRIPMHVDSYRPVRLQVYHNGDKHADGKAVTVVGPDLANMKKDHQSKIIAKSKNLLNSKNNGLLKFYGNLRDFVKCVKCVKCVYVNLLFLFEICVN